MEKLTYQEWRKEANLLWKQKVCPLLLERHKSGEVALFQKHISQQKNYPLYERGLTPRETLRKFLEGFDKEAANLLFGPVRVMDFLSAVLD